MPGQTIGELRIAQPPPDSQARSDRESLISGPVRSMIACSQDSSARSRSDATVTSSATVLALRKALQFRAELHQDNARTGFGGRLFDLREVLRRR